MRVDQARDHVNAVRWTIRNNGHRDDPTLGAARAAVRAGGPREADPPA